MDMSFSKEYSRHYPLIYKKRNYESEAKFVYRWASKPSLIIDLGCGTGAHHKYWDCAVIGIDQSADMLHQARRHKRRMYIKADIENLPEGFRGHYCYTALFNVIGYCDLEEILLQLDQPKGGIFIFDVWDKEKADKEGFTITIKEFNWGKVIIKPFKNDYSEYVLEIAVYTKKGEVIKEYHSVKPYSGSHIKRLCKKYGYICERKDTNIWTTWYKLTKERRIK